MVRRICNTVLAVARDIGRHITRYSVIADKSTVPVGLVDKVAGAIRRELKARAVNVGFDVVSDPEFQKEGAAVEVFMRPDRIVVGTGSERTIQAMDAFVLIVPILGIRHPDANIRKHFLLTMPCLTRTAVNCVSCTAGAPT